MAVGLAALACGLGDAMSGRVAVAAGAGTGFPDSVALEAPPRPARVKLPPDSLRALATLDSLATLAVDRFVAIKGPLGGTLFRVGRLYRAEVVRRGRQFFVGLYDFRLRRVSAGPVVTLLLVLPNNRLLRWDMGRVGGLSVGMYDYSMEEKEEALIDRFGKANGILHAEIGPRVENARFTWRGESVPIPAPSTRTPAGR
jgi:hypothetical protein